MAFQREQFSDFYQVLKKTNPNSHAQESAVAQNFILEERLSEQREDSYGEYLKSHIYRIGWIDKPPGKSCEDARKIHLEFLRDDFKNFDELDYGNEPLSY